MDPNVAPLKDGKPDMYNYVPTRFVSQAESQARGWTHFYIGEKCPHGHMAPRYTSNPRSCVDCDRVRQSRPLIGGKAPAEYSRPPRPYAERKAKDESVRPLEPSNLEKQFLGAYAETKEFDLAAARIEQSPAVMLSRLSWSKVFREACEELETRMGFKHVAAPQLDFDWDEEKRAILVRTFVDTGSIATARDAIRVSPYEYQLEIQRNPEFASKIDEVTPLANKVLVEKGTQLALQGNDKILTMMLKAQIPEFGDRLKVDMNVTDTKSHAQLVSDIIRVIGLARQRISGRNLISAEPEGIVESPPISDGDFSEGESEPNSDLL